MVFLFLILKFLALIAGVVLLGLGIYNIIDRFDYEDSKGLVLIGAMFFIPAIICISLFFIFNAKHKNARMIYNSDEQVIERVKVKNAKNLVKAQQNDLAQIEKMGSKKIDLLQFFIPTPEPSLYVIAPMSYDVSKFINDNSNESALFGLKSVDKSSERLTIIESCITDFQNKVDIKTGVSFLDRSKIEQIEREHKFQLGDWSNNTKTAEVGKALNANILLFLDKFGFIDSGSGEYHFEAKFVDINTMQE